MRCTLLPAACRTANYTSPISGDQYVLNSCDLRQPAADQFCRSVGGHLVSYKTLEEQQEVEAYFVEEVGGHGGTADLALGC